VNPHSAQDPLAVVEQCAYEGVARVFQHLSIDQMREPPRTMFDAKLARHALFLCERRLGTVAA